MRLLRGEERRSARAWLEECVKQAAKSTCHRSKCGSVIVKNGEVIGEGYNSPPGDETLEKCFKDDIPKHFKSDRTCCVHAEQRAILEAMKHDPTGSTIYFTRLDEEGRIRPSGRPYCTICSKLALDAGVSEWVLLHGEHAWGEEGIYSYTAREYNTLSFQHE